VLHQRVPDKGANRSIDMVSISRVEVPERKYTPDINLISGGAGFAHDNEGRQ
jgi:hypothetical protein